MSEHNYRISIQVGLSGYSFRVWEDGRETGRSGWLPSEKLFSTPEFQNKYDEVEVSVFTPKFTLVPENFYCPEKGRELLADVVDLSDLDVVKAVRFQPSSSVMIFSTSIGATLPKIIAETVRRSDSSVAEPLPEMFYMLRSLSSLPEYNKVVASYMDGILYLVIAQGKTLMLCNCFEAQDFTTAEYFIFLALKKLQLNPEVTSICFRTPLSDEEEMSLYRYFKSVDKI